MNLIELKNVQHINSHIHYRRVFEASAVLEYMGRKPEEKKIHFTIEHSPLGGTSVEIDYLEPIDYPMLPAKQILKTVIAEMDKTGKLG
ncbi:MAG: hypothetical protein D6B26_05435, partial [Spirochaetaceae bacterium]